MAVPLFVGNLAVQTTEQAIEEVFSRGGFSTVRIFLPKLGGKSSKRRYAFVYLSTAAEALRALVRLERAELDGRSLVLHIAGPVVEGREP